MRCAWSLLVIFRRLHRGLLNSCAEPNEREIDGQKSHTTSSATDECRRKKERSGFRCLRELEEPR